MAGWDEQGELTADEARREAGLTQEGWAAWTAAGYSFSRPRQNGLWGRKQAKYMAQAAGGELAKLDALLRPAWAQMLDNQRKAAGERGDE